MCIKWEQGASHLVHKASAVYGFVYARNEHRYLQRLTGGTDVRTASTCRSVTHMG
jgi:hypothetical protein